MRKGIAIARDMIETAGPASSLKMAVHTGPRGLLADGSDIAIVDVALVDKEGRTLPLAGDRVSFRISGPAKFMGGWNSGTFGEKSPVGKDWVNLECGVNRVFVKGGRKPGIVTLTATCERFSAKAIFATRRIPVRDGVSVMRQQEREINALDYTVHETHAPARDLMKVSGASEYDIYVNGVEVDFGDAAKPFKPDVATGVCANLLPVLNAVKKSGAEFSFWFYPKGQSRDVMYLRKMGLSERSVISMKIRNKKVDVVSGSTEIFENGGKVRNLTNFEFAGSDSGMAGELVYVLGYIPGVEVRTDDKAHKVHITVNCGVAVRGK